MPSVDYAAVNISSPAWLWELQNPLGATLFEAPSFLWELQNPLGSTQFDSPAFIWDTKSGAGTIYFYQRVFSSGLNVWCYYTTTTLNPTPLSGDTNPNWTGSIAAYELITTSAV